MVFPVVMRLNSRVLLCPFTIFGHSILGVCSDNGIIKLLITMPKKYISENAELMKEWDWDANNKEGLDPTQLTLGMNKKINWICAKGHKWKTSILIRNFSKSGCPFCRNLKVWPGYNDLATTNPELLKEWDYEKNTLKPTEVTAGSNKKAWWICSKGHKWERAISGRTLGNGCPYCTNEKIWPGYNDLATRHPELLKDWDYEKNTLKPTEVTARSNRKVWWKCSKGHSYVAGTAHKTEGRGCPYCANKKVLVGYNDLEHTYPEIAQEWHPTKNGDLKPTDIVAGSGKAIWWKCPKGHDYKARVRLRTIKHQGCPKCKEGNQTSFPEQALYYYVKQISPDAINRYRDIFDNGMELDIFIPSKSVAIEYDGSFYHKKERALNREKIKYNICRKHQIQLIRICAKDNSDVFNFTSDYTLIEPTLDNCDNTQGLDKIIRELLYMLESDFGWNPRKQFIKYRQISVDVNIERDRYKINAYRENTTFKKSLVAIRPDLAAEWDYKKNRGLTPEMFPSGSHAKVWWICKICGTSYPKIIRTREKLKVTCPQCNIKCKSKQYKLYMCDAKTSKILKVFNSVAEASKKTEICDSNIAGACRGSRKSAGGYIWQKKYSNEYDK